uniref:oxysterol-binding protein-related protein 6-like n=1 Tax=Myxine glutinosa TaxID=7769 RepID=UPI00358FC41D
MSSDDKASKNSSPSLSQSVTPSQPSNQSSCRESRQSEQMPEERFLPICILSPPVQPGFVQPTPRKNMEGVHVIEGLKLGCPNMENPQRHEGFLLKKRKWPLKGWHKRFFILENGILKYAKSPIEIQRGKFHGCIDVGLSVMSIKKHSQRIDLDTEEYIYHLKIKSTEAFDSWVSKLRDHRLFRQNEIAHSPGDASRSVISPLESSPAVHFADEKLSHSSSSAGLSGGLYNGQSKSSGWLFHSDEMEQCAKDLSEGQEGLAQLNAIMKSLEILHRTQSVPSFSDMQGSCLENCKKEKRSSKRWRTKSVSKDSKMHLQLPMSPVCSPVRLHASNPNLSLETTHNQEPVMGNCGGQAGFWIGGRKSLGSWGSETSSGPCLVVPSLPVSHTQSSLGESLQEHVGDSARLQMEYCELAQKVHFLLRTVFNMVAIEKDKLKQVVSEHEALNSGHAAQINNLKKTLAQTNGSTHIHGEMEEEKFACQAHFASSPPGAARPAWLSDVHGTHVSRQRQAGGNPRGAYAGNGRQEEIAHLWPEAGRPFERAINTAQSTGNGENSCTTRQFNSFCSFTRVLVCLLPSAFSCDLVRAPPDLVLIRSPAVLPRSRCSRAISCTLLLISFSYVLVNGLGAGPYMAPPRSYPNVPSSASCRSGKPHPSSPDWRLMLTDHSSCPALLRPRSTCSGLPRGISAPNQKHRSKVPKEHLISLAYSTQN